MKRNVSNLAALETAEERKVKNRRFLYWHLAGLGVAFVLLTWFSRICLQSFSSSTTMWHAIICGLCATYLVFVIYVHLRLHRHDSKEEAEYSFSFLDILSSAFIALFFYCFINKLRGVKKDK